MNNKREHIEGFLIGLIVFSIAYFTAQWKTDYFNNELPYAVAVIAVLRHGLKKSKILLFYIGGFYFLTFNLIKLYIYKIRVISDYFVGAFPIQNLFYAFIKLLFIAFLIEFFNKKYIRQSEELEQKLNDEKKELEESSLENESSYLKIKELQNEALSYESALLELAQFEEELKNTKRSHLVSKISEFISDYFKCDVVVETNVKGRILENRIVETVEDNIKRVYEIPFFMGNEVLGIIKIKKMSYISNMKSHLKILEKVMERINKIAMETSKTETNKNEV